MENIPFFPKSVEKAPIWSKSVSISFLESGKDISFINASSLVVIWASASCLWLEGCDPLSPPTHVDVLVHAHWMVEFGEGGFTYL